LESLRNENLTLDRRLSEARSDYERVIIAEAERIKLLQKTESNLKKAREEASNLRVGI
jgi:hypothetical protein